MITPDKSDSIIFSTPRFDVIREAHEGRDYYYVEKPNSCICIIHDSFGKFLLLRSRRVNISGAKYELAGGRVETGEAPIEAIAREVAEEVGINVRKSELIEIASIHPLPSVTTEICHIFAYADEQLLRTLETSQACTIGHEGIEEITIVSKYELQQLILEGKISSAIDAYALLRFDLMTEAREET